MLRSLRADVSGFVCTSARSGGRHIRRETLTLPKFLLRASMQGIPFAIVLGLSPFVGFGYLPWLIFRQLHRSRLQLPLEVGQFLRPRTLLQPHRRMRRVRVLIFVINFLGLRWIVVRVRFERRRVKMARMARWLQWLPQRRSSSLRRPPLRMRVQRLPQPLRARPASRSIRVPPLSRCYRWNFLPARASGSTQSFLK